MGSTAKDRVGTLTGKEGSAMSSHFIDHNGPFSEGAVPKLAKDLPHGLIAAAEKVRELLQQEWAKQPHLSAESRVRMLNDRTLQDHFDNLCQEVLYRSTPVGREVLAMGFDEIFDRTNGMDPEGMKVLKTFLGY
jgi:hypothetical protein